MAAQAKTPLGLYRTLAPSAGVLVSPLQVGTMSLGTQWPTVGVLTKEEAFKFLDVFFDAGGNFLDTASY